MIDIKNMFVPMLGGAPTLLRIKNKLFVPVFSTREKYNEAAISFDFQASKCGLITDQDNFIDSVLVLRKRFPVFLVSDPYLTEGNTKFDMLFITNEDLKLYQELDNES